jgi:hypothetical protein
MSSANITSSSNSQLTQLFSNRDSKKRSFDLSDAPNVLNALANSFATARASDKSAWTKITVPQKDSPAATKTVPYGAQRAFRRDVTEETSSLPAALKGKPFDAGSIGKNAGRIVILGQLGANDLQDTYKITLVNAGKLKLFAPNPDYNSKVPGSRASLGDAQIDVFDSKGKRIATSDTRDSVGFSNWVSLSTENFGVTPTSEGAFPGLALQRGAYTVKVTRENPEALFKVGINKAGELDFTGSVMNDVATVDTVVRPVAGEVTVKNSAGDSYTASLQLVKRSDAGVSTSTTPTATEGKKGGPDKWELQLIGLKPVKSTDPKPNPAISLEKPVSLGVFSAGAKDASGKALPATFTPSGVEISFADVKKIAATADQPAREEVTPVEGKLSFALKDSNAAAPAGVVVINPGDFKTSLDGAKSVPNSKNVNYTLFAAIGDPGATSFYTVKTAPQTAEQKKEAERTAAINAARSSATRSNSAGIVSLFT